MKKGDAVSHAVRGVGTVADVNAYGVVFVRFADEPGTIVAVARKNLFELEKPPVRCPCNEANALPGVITVVEVDVPSGEGSEREIQLVKYCKDCLDVLVNEASWVAHTAGVKLIAVINSGAE